MPPLLDFLTSPLLDFFMTIILANKYFYLRGGAENYMLTLSNWLTLTGHTVIPFAMRYSENLPTPYEKYFPSEVETENVKLNARGLHTLGRMIYSLESRRKLATLIVDTKPDLAHVHNIYTQLSPSILHTLSDQHVPIVMTVHDHHLISPQYNVWADGCGPASTRRFSKRGESDNRDVGLIRGTASKFHKNSYAASFAQLVTHKYHRWLNIYARNVDIFLCPSKYIQQQLIRGGFPEKKLRVLPYGIDAGEGIGVRVVPDGSYKLLILATILFPVLIIFWPFLFGGRFFVSALQARW